MKRTNAKKPKRQHLSQPTDHKSKLATAKEYALHCSPLSAGAIRILTKHESHANLQYIKNVFDK